MDTKPEAMVYDATAGNRTIWVTKDHPFVLFGDIETELTIQPDDFIDSRDTGLPDESKYMIIFDPPHSVNYTRYSGFMTTPNLKDAQRKWGKKLNGSRPPRYYGADIYKTKKELKNYIFQSQKEFMRILKPSGVLFLKWNERNIKFNDIIKLFSNWDLMLKIKVQGQGSEGTKNKTYWALLMKTQKAAAQTELTEALK